MTDVKKVVLLKKKRIHDGDWLQNILTSAAVDDILLQPEDEHISDEVTKHKAESTWTR